MSIQNFLHTYNKTIKVLFFVFVGVPVFLFVFGFLRMFLSGGSYNSDSNLNDSFLSAAPKTAGESLLTPRQSSNSKMMVSAPSQDGVSNGYDTSVEQVDKQIIKTANLSLVVKEVEIAVADIKGIVESLDGSVDNQNIYESSNNQKYGNIVVRVPSDNFEPAIQTIKETAQKVTSENINSTDVTEEYTDLSAQLKNLKSVEAQYVEVLQKAETIEDILKVRNVLDSTRSEIERLQGRMQYLERQVSMSTISINLVSEKDVEVLGIVWSPITKIKQAAFGALESLVVFVYTIISVVFFIPILILWTGLFVVAVLFFWKLGFWLKRFFEKKKKKETK